MKFIDREETVANRVADASDYKTKNSIPGEKSSQQLIARWEVVDGKLACRWVLE